MKVILINPPMTHIVKSTISDFIDGLLVDHPLPPLGLMYVAAYLRQHGHNVKVVDMNVIPYTLEIPEDTNFIGISATTLTLYDAILLAKNIKGFRNKIPIVLGGPHTNIYPAETAAMDCFDYVVCGEGELPFLQLLNGYDEWKIIKPTIIENIDDIPFPARDLVGINQYHSALSKRPVTTAITSRGCPMSCTFCYQPHYGQHWRARSAINVVDEMESIFKMGIREIEFYDDTFTFDANRVINICDEINSRGLKVDWNIRTRVDKVDYEMLKFMKEAGCKRINYGIESASPEVLKTLRKGFTIDQAIKAIEWTNKVGIEIQAYFMLGNPDETDEQMRSTIRFANKYIPDYCYYSLTAPFPGTKLYKDGIEQGIFDDFWKEFALNPTLDFRMKFWAEDKREELVRLMKDGYRSFYYDPRRILKKLIKIKSWNELKEKAKIATRMAR